MVIKLNIICAFNHIKTTDLLYVIKVFPTIYLKLDCLEMKYLSFVYKIYRNSLQTNIKQFLNNCF